MNKPVWFAAVLVAVCTFACSSSTSQGHTAPSSSGAPGRGDVTATEMSKWVDTMVSFGIRRPGYPGDDRAARWIAARFREAGLHNVRLDPVRLNRWTPQRCRVTWWSDARPATRTTVSCLALPYSKPKVDLTASLVADDGKVALRGGIGVIRDQFQAIPQSVLASAALDVVAPAEFVKSDQQPIPFGIRNGDLFSDFFGPTTARGGMGMIGILQGLGTDQYYAPYTGKDVDLPAVWMGESPGAALLAAMADGPVTAHIESVARAEIVTSHNVIGDLPAPSATWVVIGSHHDAPWASAVEDASGIAQVLAQARHWASVPVAQRPHKLMFLASAGHMAGAAGSAAVVAKYPEIMDRTVLEVHLEHIARRAEMTSAGLKVTDQSETRWWFTPRDRPDLRAVIKNALQAQGLHRDLILPSVGFFGSTGPLSDAAPFSLANVPIISLISTPIYLFDPRDTPRMVDTETMESVSAAATRMIEASKGLTVTRTGTTAGP
jgi:hypothetical protein